MRTHNYFLIAALTALAGNAQAALTDLSTTPLVNSSNTVVKPNIMYALDDSGSMSWDYVPDYVTSSYCKTGSGGTTGCKLGDPPYNDADFNGVAYNPAVTYTPPVNADGTHFASMGSPWTAVPIDGFGVQSSSSKNLVTGYPDRVWCTDSTHTSCVANNDYTYPNSTYSYAYTVNGAPYYYTIVPQQYCTAADLRSCTNSTVPTGSYTYPARIRWCTDSTLSQCQATQAGAYQKLNIYGAASSSTPAVPETLASASFQIKSLSSGAKITSIQVNGIEILGPTNATGSNIGALAASVVSLANSYTSSPEYTVTCSGNCSSGGSGWATITVTALPGTGASPNGWPFSVTRSNVTLRNVPSVIGGGITAVPASTSAGSPAALFQRIDIVPATTSYTKYATRTDCAGASCSYTEEMSNFANWYAYYHTRMQMMKTAAGLAFANVDSRYRVGFMSMNNNTGSDFLNIADFDATQKANWYAKFYAVVPSNSTPLRSLLSVAGRIYAKDISSYNGQAVTDPIQYSCQQNFTILSTDGYWNTGSCNSGSAGCINSGAGSIIGGGAVGNYDNVVTTTPRPLFDGGAATNASGTLADIAEYYYQTDLRPTPSIGALNTDVSQDNVPTNAKDTAVHQHMTTFTLGLGAPGDMTYSPSYETDVTGDYYNVKVGTANNASSSPCAWSAANSPCNWPVPAADQPSAIDDLWHAAVNGRGTYYSAANPAALSTGLADALAGVSARVGAAAAATTSNPNVTSGDNFIFSSTFTTVDWTGELVRQQIDLTTGAISPTIDWSAQALLDAKAYTTRNIYTFDPSAANKRKTFTWSTLTSAPTAQVAVAEQSYFNSTTAATLSQYPTLNATQQAALGGTSLVNYLDGDRSNEGTLYRARKHVLGDIVSAEAVYVKAPIYNYVDAGYSAFKTANANREGMVYAAANDGMLHAFDATTGQEQWAYVPSIVMPNLYKLADVNYGTNHRYFVDGTPTSGDAYFNGAWHTLLIGGLNAGGRGYYALDVTDPANPTVLWEFTSNTSAGPGYVSDADLGYSYGNPVIAKKRDGTWTVMMSSGYNNVSPGDGIGYLYVLNAQTGAIISKISTAVGDTSTSAPATSASPTGCVTSANGPSGLARINAWVDNAMADDTATQVYGGDLYGNLWRFDINGAYVDTSGATQDIGNPGIDAFMLASFRSSSGACVQSVTEKPELGLVGTTDMVYVGTGRYLGASDIGNLTPQSFYAVKDLLGTVSYGTGFKSNAVQQTLTDTTNPVTGARIRTSTSNSVDLTTKNGWYIDFPATGDTPPTVEISDTDPALALGTLTFTTNVPNGSACSVGGYSFEYFLDYKTGAPITSSSYAANTVGIELGQALATRPVMVRLPNGVVVSLIKLSDTSTSVTNVPTPGNTLGAKRVSWHELLDDQ